MARAVSKVAPLWWDYTTLDSELLDDAARLSADDLLAMSRPGFEVRVFDTSEEFFLAEALEYIDAWKQSTADNPAGICGPIGPTEQLPLVARIVNDLDIDIREGHFWGMDEWVDENDNPVPVTPPLSFAKADLDMCFNRIKPNLRMSDERIHFPVGDLEAYSKSYDDVRFSFFRGAIGTVEAEMH